MVSSPPSKKENHQKPSMLEQVCHKDRSHGWWYGTRSRCQASARYFFPLTSFSFIFSSEFQPTYSLSCGLNLPCAPAVKPVGASKAQCKSDASFCLVLSGDQEWLSTKRATSILNQTCEDSLCSWMFMTFLWSVLFLLRRGPRSLLWHKWKKATKSEVCKFYLVNIGQKSQALQPQHRATWYSISKGKFKYHWPYWKREGFSYFFSCYAETQNTNCFPCSQSLPILFHLSSHQRDVKAALHRHSRVQQDPQGTLEIWHLSYRCPRPTIGHSNPYSHHLLLSTWLLWVLWISFKVSMVSYPTRSY